MAKPKVDLPNLANATHAFLVDEIGRLDEEEKRATILKDYHKEALKAILGGKLQVEGERYTINIGMFDQTRINADLVRENVSPEILEKVTVRSSVTQMRVVKKEVASGRST